ncbi:MAG TPA: branched-chain amino acid ABC transporter permease [Verrucomicrobiae bacterium]|nr:branched-chain amino acid ABC transporter permease [Verrucomicrobiae bacterium]
MSSGTIFYITTLIVYGGVDVVACLGLSLQFGTAGITNFGFIIYQAAGAYTAAVLSMPRDTANGGFQSYVLGLHLPFPIPWIGAAVAGGLLAVPAGLVVRRSLRPDFAGVSMLVTAVVLNTVVDNFVPLFNGAAGIALVPSPLSNVFNPQSLKWQWMYSGIAIFVCVLVFLGLRLITESPYGRSLRAMREDETAAKAIGKNTDGLRITILVVGGAIAGLSGGILVGFINLWAPSAWTYPETIVLIAALIVGGRGNNFGAILGALLVPLGFLEATRFIPPFGPPGLVPALEWIVTGTLILVFLWFRPQGVVPERRRRLSKRLPAAAGPSAPGSGVVGVSRGQ